MESICELLGTKYPLIMGALGSLSNPELVAAVSEAGGYGLIATISMDRRQAADAIRAVKDLTDKPFGVNIVAMNPNGPELVELLVEQGVKAATVSAGSPKVLAPLLAEAGIGLLQVVPSPRLAQKAEAVGASAVVAEGSESGGMQSPEAISTFCLVPQVVDAVGVPVVAAGGIYNARGYAAAFALGASGVQLGTRLILTEECCADSSYKKALLEAGPTDTAVLPMSIAPVRGLKNPWALSLSGMDLDDAIKEVTKAWANFSNTSVIERAADSLLMTGECAGAIEEIMPAGELVRQMVEGGEELLRSLG